MFLGLPDQDPLVRCTAPAPDPAPDSSFFLINALSGNFFKTEHNVHVGKL
jgi:hypothetical protein